MKLFILDQFDSTGLHLQGQVQVYAKSEAEALTKAPFIHGTNYTYVSLK